MGWITRAMLERYASERMKDWKDWYMTIREFFLEISSREILKIS